MPVSPVRLVLEPLPEEPFEERPPRIEGSAFERTLFTSFLVAPVASLTLLTVSAVIKSFIILLISISDLLQKTAAADSCGPEF